jgi:hypothetical protein
MYIVPGTILVLGGYRYLMYYQFCGSGSVRTRNFLPDPDPQLEVLDPGPDPSTVCFEKYGMF